LFTKNSQRNLNKLYQLQEEIIKLKEDSVDNNVYFEDLGINTLYLDEAHNYKNYPVLTQNKYVLGISNSTSKKCVEMYDKVKIVQSQNNGGGIVFATATPITNSLTDIFVMQKYLQEGELKLLNLQNFLLKVFVLR
jgi:N12 class adenine-specific DNA methylase